MKNHAHANRTKNTLQDPKTRKSTNVAATASVVTVLSVAERGLGFLYRIVLSRLIGAEGLGLYQVALSLFAVFLTVGTGGIPITVSRLISKSKAENDPYGERRAVSSGLFLSLLFTLPVVLLLGAFSQYLPFLFTDERTVPLFKILLIGLIFSALYAVFRGHFWGNKRFLLPSVLEISEEAVMVIAGVLLLQGASSVTDGATRAVIAVVISYLFSFTASALCFFFGGGRLASPKPALKPLFKASLPITSVRAGSSLVGSVVSTLLPAMLIRAGASQAEAVKLLGVVSGMVLPVLMIPGTVIGSLALILVPELSEDFYRKNRERLYKNIRRGIRFSVCVACFLLPFFYAFGEDVGLLAFADPLAGEYIRTGCPILLPMSITMITTAILNSMGFEKQTFVFYFIGAAAMLLCILFLPAVCGAYAYIIGQGANYLVNAVCNLVFLAKKCPGLFKRQGKTRLQTEFRAVLAVLPLALLSSLFSALFKNLFGEFLALVFAALCTLLATVLVYAVFGILPVKDRIAKFAEKRRLHKEKG